MKTFVQEIAIETTNPFEFIDVTSKVADACARSGVSEGIATIITHHTTTGIKINEKCERLQLDMKEFLEGVVPKRNYRHDEKTVDGRANGRSHLMSLLLNASETVPVSKGRPLLGGWQSIFFVELDGPRRERNIVVKVIGK